MSKDLKDQLIRLGSTNPDLQKHLRPVIAVLDMKTEVPARLRVFLKGGDGFFVRAYIGRKKVGQIACVNLAQAIVIQISGILPEYQKQGIGAAMYRKAAETACKEYQKPLKSSNNRSSPAAQALWTSEVRAGFAKKTLRGFQYPCD